KALSLLQRFADRLPSMRQTEGCDAVLVLGEDVTQTAPRLALSLRQAVRNQHKALATGKGIPKWHARGVRDNGQYSYSPLFIASPTATRLDDVATGLTRERPDAIARLGFAVAHALDSAAPQPEELDDDLREQAEPIAEALQGADKPLIVVGTSLGSEAILEAGGNIMQALTAANDNSGLFVTPLEANSIGMAMMDGLAVDDALAQVENGAADTLVVMENDLFNRVGRTRAESAMKAARSVIVIDHCMTDTVAGGDYVLPAGSFVEADGTYINNAGRAQRAFQAFIPEGPMQEAWRWCAELAVEGSEVPVWPGMAEIIDAIVAELPQFTGIEKAAPSTSFRKAGMRFPRSPHRYSARTALYANVNVHEPLPVTDHDSPMSFTMEGYYGQDTPHANRAYSWAPGWNSNQQSISKFQDEVSGALKEIGRAS